MIYLATDHTGLEIKDQMKKFLSDEGYAVEDCGAFTYDKDDDYPDFISKAAEQVSKDPENNKAIIFGGSGEAEMMVANKYPGVRAALFYSLAVPVQAVDITGQISADPYEIVKLTREHNNANVLSLAIRFLTEDQIKQAIKIWLDTPFPGDERHFRRINKIAVIEKSLK